MMHAPILEAQQIKRDAFVELQQVTHAYGRGDKQAEREMGVFLRRLERAGED